MREILDFTGADLSLNIYGDSERKSTVLYKGRQDMVKSCDPARRESLRLSMGYQERRKAPAFRPGI